ncbi:MAG: hypothetical protein IIB57_12240, partial [Planctomycetes bacterium]|nr:hypothetical protein [Planctomycetota bacterium]
MNTQYNGRWRLICVFSICAGALGGCNEESGTTDGGNRAPVKALTTTSVLGPESSPVEIDMSKGWCGGHGVPESVCTRCGASPEKFKDAGDWCEEHDLPESQCVVCHPEVAAEWAKLNPANQKDNQSGDVPGGKSDTHGSI